MATFVSASPTAFVPAGSSTLTIERPEGTKTGDIMLAFAFSRFGRFVHTSPAGASSGHFFVVSESGKIWVTRAGVQTLLYRVVRDGEPASYTFEFVNTDPTVNGAVEDSFLVGTIVAYRGADISGSVGSDIELPTFGSGEPITYNGPGAGWEGSIVADGRQFDGFAGAENSESNPIQSPAWYTIVEDQLAILVVSVDWTGPYTTGLAASMPDPPTDVAIALPAGFTRRSGADSPWGGLVTIADGPGVSDPAIGAPGTLVGHGTWRGVSFALYDTAYYRLTSPTLDTPNQVHGGITYAMQALLWVMAVYAGEVGCPPRLAAAARTASERVRVQ